MKTIFGSLVITGSLLLGFSSAAPTVQAAPKSAGLICPVTALPIASPALAVGKSVYKGKTYYFCTSNCKHLFDKSPAKYAKAKS